MNRLLFIEDDDEIRLALRLALEDEGYVVAEARDGKAGLAAFDRDEPDLVLLDLRLPDIQGFDVCRTLRAKSIVPIMIVTAQTDTYDLVAGLEAGADDYVTKPVVAKELAARIRALLRRVQLHGSASRRRPASVTSSCAVSRVWCSSGAKIAAHQDRVLAAVRIRRPPRHGAVTRPAAGTGLGLRLPRRQPPG